jgi:hypothetical protein
MAVLADRPLRHYAPQWLTGAQAQHHPLSSAARLVASGVFATVDREVAMAVAPESPAENPATRRNDWNPGSPARP